MNKWLHLADAIDRFSERSGRILYWLTVIMVALGVFNSLARYSDRVTGFGLSSNRYLEMQWYLFSALFLLGAAYTLRHDAHVRVDVLFARLSVRGKAAVNLAGVLFLLVPFSVLVIWVSVPSVANSWAVLEMSPDPGGLPRYPIKTIVPLAFVLVLIQGISLGIRQVAVLLNKSERG